MNTQYPPAAAAVTFEEESESESESEDEECIVAALALLRVVYGEVDSAEFPLPLETYEAGPCKNGQRRYLFCIAILAYQTLAEWYTAKEDVQRANVYHRAVERLIAAVHDSLGKPRNRGPASKMRECAISPTGYVGLRIRTGKV